MRIDTVTDTIIERRVVYIAGPFRAKRHPGSQWEQTCNIREAEALALRVWAHGHVALCPHLNTANFQGALPDGVWLSGDLILLRRCDCVLVLPGWVESSGAQEEVAFARESGIPVFRTLEAMLRYFDAEDRGDVAIRPESVPPSGPSIGDYWIVQGKDGLVTGFHYVWDGVEWKAV